MALLSDLSNAELLAHVRSLIERGNAVEADLLTHLAEVDARRLYAEEGCSSMFVYCVRVLHFAEGVAYKRIQATRAARSHPEILEALRSGDLHLTAVGLLAPRLTKENCAELIAAARHRSAEQVKQLLADRAPRPAPPASIRLVREPVTRGQVARLPELAAPPPPSDTAVSQKPITAPLGAELLNQVRKQKFAETSRPRPARSCTTHDKAASRHIPAAIRRAVWERDRGAMLLRVE